MSLAVWIGVATFSVTALEGIVSYYEETFFRRQWRHMHMNFLNNWGVSIGGTLIFPLLNALVVPLLVIRGYLVVAALAAGLVIAFLLHRSWWGHPENLGHVFADWSKSGSNRKYWMRDLMKAGWIDLIFMTFQTAIIILYLLSPMPGGTVTKVAILFVIFLAIVHWQAGLIQGSINMWFLISGLLAVCFFTYIKL